MCKHEFQYRMMSELLERMNVLNWLWVYRFNNAWLVLFLLSTSQPFIKFFHTFLLYPGLRHPFSLQEVLGPLQQTVKQNIKEGCFFFHFHCFEIGLLLLFLRTVKHFNDKLLLNVTLLLLSDVNTAYFFHHYVTSRKGKGSTSN